MVIERFHNRDPKPIYRRLRYRGRQMPDGLKYVDSWIDPTFERCFQLMNATTRGRCNNGSCIGAT
jgi:hypothetical protein